MEALSIVPMHPGEGRELELLNGFPRPLSGWASDKFCLVIPVHGLSERIVITVANSLNRCNSSDLCQAFGTDAGLGDT